MATKLKVEAVCERLGVSRAHLNQMYFVNDGPPRIRVSARRFLWDEDSLEEWLRSREERGRVSA